jgi:hypothetical protein
LPVTSSYRDGLKELEEILAIGKKLAQRPGQAGILRTLPTIDAPNAKRSLTIAARIEPFSSGSGV